MCVLAVRLYSLYPCDLCALSSLLCSLPSSFHALRHRDAVPPNASSTSNATRHVFSVHLQRPLNELNWRLLISLHLAVLSRILSSSSPPHSSLLHGPPLHSTYGLTSCVDSSARSNTIAKQAHLLSGELRDVMWYINIIDNLNPLRVHWGFFFFTCEEPLVV